MKLRKKKLGFWRRYYATLNSIDYACFAQERNRLRSFIQYDYESQFANNIKDNAKVFWQYINSKLKTEVSVESLQLNNGDLAVTDQDKADALNSYFSIVFLQRKILQTSR